MFKISTWTYLFPNLYWDISQNNDMNWIKFMIESCQNPIIELMSQIIGFVYNFLSKLNKMRNKTWEKLLKKKEIRNAKNE